MMDSDQVEPKGLVMHVLIAEDEPVIALDIEAMLLDLGCRPVGPAASIREAAALVERCGCDAAILDITLADGDSYDFAAILVERNVPILFATGRDVETRPDRLIHVPSVTKPFDAAAFGQAIAALKAQVERRR